MESFLVEVMSCTLIMASAYLVMCHDKCSTQLCLVPHLLEPTKMQPLVCIPQLFYLTGQRG